LEELYRAASPNTVSLCYPYAFNDGKPEIQLPFSITDVYDTYHLRTDIRLSSKVRKYFSGPCMKLIPKSFIQGRIFDVRFKNGEDSLFMFSISDKINKLSFTSREAIYYRRYRENSAVTQQRSLAQRFTNAMRIIREYIKIYVNSPHTYSFRFLITRILGTLKSIFFIA
jgi:hypothetical protein